jgi:hypothetical protein
MVFLGETIIMRVLIGIESDFCSCLIRYAHKIDPATIVDWAIIQEVLLGIEDRGGAKGCNFDSDLSSFSSFYISASCRRKGGLSPAMFLFFSVFT